ncbi:uncharacterized protein TNCV_3698421 [Trichonephila clavipes]|uniref:Uncharacterized protein n=1 Tax=Trichonephila clavipes TaxID=2585209 RepID=A0A8X6SEE8_TRICX|nr:uncharacterized protein TNCV_3698421 [Trichonephila clavipes]
MCLVGEILQRIVEKSRSTPEKYRQEDGLHLQQHVFVKKTLRLAFERLRCRANPNLFRRSFEPFDQMLYHRMVLEPHTAYPIPAGTRFILLTTKETVRSKGLQATTSDPGSCTGRDKQKTFGTTARAFIQKERVVISPVIRPPLAPVLIIKLSTALATPQPVSIPEPPEQTTPQSLLPDPPEVETTSQILLPDPPEQTTSQILLPDPPEQTTSQILLTDPPVVETLEPTLTDDSSIDQIMSSVFGDYLPQGIPSAHSQVPQVLVTVPSLFDESNDLISFLDHFEAGLAIEQQEGPMDLTMPRMKKKVKNTTGFKVFEPLNLSIRNCLPCITTLVGPVSTAHHYRLWKPGSVAGSSHVLRARLSLYHPFEPNFGVHIPRSFGKTVIVFTSHLDLTWDQRVELRFFQVGRPPSHRVWEAYQLHMTDAYSVDLTDCSRVADVYVKWLTWLDDWEMHRDDPVPWRIVGLQPWKRALEQHVQRSHEKALAHGMPSDVTLLDHI